MASAADPASPPGTASRIELAVDGVTCASGATRVQRRLAHIDGVEAAVSPATGRAMVTCPPRVSTVDLVAAVESSGHSARVLAVVPSTMDDAVAVGLGARLLACLVLALPVAAMSLSPALRFWQWQWAVLGLAALVVLWGLLPVHRSTASGLRRGVATTDTLVSLGTLTAFGWSLYTLSTDAAGAGVSDVFGPAGERAAAGGAGYATTAAGVALCVLAARYFEARLARYIGGAVRWLWSLRADDAALLRDGRESRIPARRLGVGDRFVVRPGERIATDGVVEEGSSAVDASLLTGPATPVGVGPGDAVVGAAVNADGRLVVRTTRVGPDTQLARMIRLVEQAQFGKARIQRLVDQVSGTFVPAVVVLALGTLGFWLGTGAGLACALTAATTVLVAACPRALHLAAPAAFLSGVRRGAQLGMLMPGPRGLEAACSVDTLIVGKTGTITTGRMALIDVLPADGVDPDHLLRVAGALEGASTHPIAVTIAAAARDRVGTLPPVERFADVVGLGAQGVVEGHAVVLGRTQLLAAWSLHLPTTLAEAKSAAEKVGNTVVIVGWCGAVRGLLVVADTVRPASARAVARLRQLGLTPILLTGDSRTAARTVAAQVGIDDVVAEVLPARKAEMVNRLRAQGRVVALVRAGGTDGPAVAQADVRVRLAAGADVATGGTPTAEAGDLTLLRGDLWVFADAVRLSRQTVRTVNSNLSWVFCHHLICLPLAVAGLLNPLLAAVAAAASSLFVLSNGLRLRDFTAMATESAAGAPGTAVQGAVPDAQLPRG